MLQINVNLLGEKFYRPGGEGRKRDMFIKEKPPNGAEIFCKMGVNIN